ncbi:hypothetical protein QVD17_31837 [Tagetes erecta]|uniref:C2 domain-containing protein n=1 Tax=Tagetes erecta TaxID=13708 RepID=A0AAD8K456_TARER|nr:hypothetical protein QVD17_31837 [Tagetes erecta]
MKYYRTLELTLFSAKELPKPKTTSNLNAYAVVSISGTNKPQKFTIPIDNDTDPTSMKFTVNEAACLKNRLTLVVKIKAKRMFFDKKLGEVRVPINELLARVKTDQGVAMQTVSFPMSKRHHEPEGVVSFSYKFGDRYSVLSSAKVATRGRRGRSGVGIGAGVVGGLVLASAASSACGGACGCGGC